ncbi:MAG: hypothetical protein HYX32_04020 [Actinobacteria bacterium]|nr:hypothetical protein [Actinomycetota bacterium]
MTNPTTDSDLAAMLQDRAAAVRPHAPAPATIAARSRRLRRRRNAVASAGAATAASVAVVTGAVALRTSADDQQAAVDVAAPIVPRASVTAPSTTTPPPRSGPPLRIGLELTDAQVTSVSDNVEAEQPTNEPPGVRVEYQNAAGTRQLSISTVMTSPPPADQKPFIYIPGPGTKRPVDLGDGVQGTLSTIDVIPGGTSSAISVEAIQDGAGLLVYGVGLSEDEMLSIASSVVISQRGAGFDAPGVPGDLVAGRPGSPFDGRGWGVRTQVVYRTADGTEVVVDVYNGGGENVFEPDLQKAKTQPTGVLYELSVRGREAVVRRFPDMASPTNGEIVTVTWREATGQLVAVRFTPPPNIVPDPTVVAPSVKELTEPEFQALLAEVGQR